MGKVPDAWKDKPAKLRQKDRDARWTVKFSKAKVAEDGKAQQRDIAIPAFGYKNHASIDRRHGFIRGWNVTGASAYDGAQLRNVLDRSNTGSFVWADTAYRSRKNEAWLEKNGFRSDIHHKKPKGRPMSEAMSRANGRRSKIRAFVEHVFAQQKSRMRLFVRTIGIARARTKIGMANLAYNLTRFVWHQGRTALASRAKAAETAALKPKSAIHVSPSSSQRHALRGDGTRRDPHGPRTSVGSRRRRFSSMSDRIARR